MGDSGRSVEDVCNSELCVFVLTGEGCEGGKDRGLEVFLLPRATDVPWGLVVGPTYNRQVSTAN